MKEILNNQIDSHKNILIDISRSELIEKSVKNKNAIISKNGALATWTHKESTGRSPKDTYIVKNHKSKKKIDWSSPNNNPLDPKVFKMIWNDAIQILKEKDELFVTNRVIGADAKYALKVKTISDSSLTALFTLNMFREEDIFTESIFKDEEFQLIVLPYDKLKDKKYSDKIVSDMVIASDFDNKRGVVIGSSYGGSVKKLMFTAMSFYLPDKNVLPIHCSANKGKDGNSAIFLGLSGTGKTTLSGDKNRSLLGDDEHGWSDDGIFNFENGCYAKMIDIDYKKEPEIYDAVMHKDDYKNHGVIIENAMMYPNGTFDFFDSRLTKNSRASYPLSFLKNIKKSSKSVAPKTVIFLAADANGVLPPIAKLSIEQAMFWYLMGYTSKLAGTETGVVDPQTTFSRFFGEPFMVRNPDDYARLFGKYIKKYETTVYLVNTGWTGGPYGEGKRFDILVTKKIVNAALSYRLKNVDYENEKYFKLKIPTSCPGISKNILNPRNTWKNKEAYDLRAKKLANEFANHFDKTFKGKVDSFLENVCPGK